MSDERQPDDWELEWENWFDDLDHAITRMLALAAKAEKEGFINLDYQLVMAASALELVAMRCKDFVNLRVIELQTEIYKQNPLLKFMMENATNIRSVLHVSPFSAPVAPDDSSQPD